MKNGSMDFKNILEVILKTTNKNANILADSYLIKDATTICKWKTNKLIPRSDDILKIVDFTMNESTGIQRKMIRDRIEALLSASLLKENIKSELLKIEDFQEFLLEALNVSISGEADDAKCSESKGNTANSETVTAFSNDFEGKYSGVVEFNLVLSKGDGGPTGDKPHEPGTDFKNKLDFSIKSRLGGLQRQYIGRGVLGVIAIGVLSGLFIFHLANNPQPIAKNLTVYAAKGEMKTSTPIPTDSPIPTSTPKPTHIPVHRNTPPPVKKSPAADTEKNHIDQNDEYSGDININGRGNNVVTGNHDSAVSIHNRTYNITNDEAPQEGLTNEK